MEFTLLWAALTGVGFAWLGARIWPTGLPDHSVDRMIGAAAVGLLAGRLAAMLAQGTNPLTHPGDILIVRGGVETIAAALAAVATFLWSVRGEIRFADATAAPAILGLAGWHAGCLWRGACLGTVADLPWAWALPGSEITRHPVEIYTAIALAACAVVVSRLPAHRFLRFGAAILGASLVRLATEPLRLTLGSGLIWWYTAGVGVGLLVVIFGLSRSAIRQST